MADDQHRVKEPHPKRTNTWIVALGLVCVAGSIYYGFDEFGRRSREQVEAINAQTAVMEAQMQQKVYDEKVATYKTVTEAAAKIAALKAAGAPAAQMQDAVSQFKALAWGPVSVSEGANINKALALFNRGLDAGADAGQLQQLSLDLAGVCAYEAHNLLPGAARNAIGSSLASPSQLQHMEEIVRGPESQQAAARWLGLLDAGQFTESWKEASGYFQATIPQERWERAIGAIRAPAGSMVSRKLKSADYTTSIPGAPAGDYMVLQFDTSFASKNDAAETVTLVLDKDSQWRVSAYAIK